MVVYLVCFNLSETPEEQRAQIFYWLQFLNSSVPNLTVLNTSPESTNNNNTTTSTTTTITTTMTATNNTNTNDNRNWRVMVVGLKSDKMTKTTFTIDTIQSWQYQMPNLPFHNNLFHVSSLRTQQSVRDLLSSIEHVCSQIFSTHTILIPPTYRKSLQSIENSNLTLTDPFTPFQHLHEQLKNEHNMDLSAFKHALKYLHMIGRIVFLQNGLVCKSPTMIPKILSKFISPAEVRNRLLFTKESDVIQILTQKEIGFVLQIDPSRNALGYVSMTWEWIYFSHCSSLKNRLTNEIELLLELKVCFKLGNSNDNREIEYIFPSLGSEGLFLSGNPISFLIFFMFLKIFNITSPNSRTIRFLLLEFSTHWKAQCSFQGFFVSYWWRFWLPFKYLFLLQVIFSLFSFYNQKGLWR